MNKSRIIAMAVAIVILAVSVVPALAGFDPGSGAGSFDLAERYPAAVLQAEGWQ